MKKTILVLAIIIIIGGVWWWQKPKQAPTQDDPYKDWISYDTSSASIYIFQDLENPFSIKYPADLKFDETKGGLTIFIEGMLENEKLWIDPFTTCDDAQKIEEYKTRCFTKDDKEVVALYPADSEMTNTYEAILRTFKFSD